MYNQNQSASTQIPNFQQASNLTGSLGGNKTIFGQTGGFNPGSTSTGQQFSNQQTGQTNIIGGGQNIFSKQTGGAPFGGQAGMVTTSPLLPHGTQTGQTGMGTNFNPGFNIGGQNQTGMGGQMQGQGASGLGGQMLGQGQGTSGINSQFGQGTNLFSTGQAQISFKPQIVGTQNLGLMQTTTTNSPFNQPMTQVPQQLQMRPQTGPATLSSTNMTKHESVESVDQIKILVKAIAKESQDAKNSVEATNNAIDEMTKNFKIFAEESSDLISLFKLIVSKTHQMFQVIENLRAEVEKELKGINSYQANFESIFERFTPITVPSEYFLTLLKECEENIEEQIIHIKDLGTLADLQIRKDYGAFKVDHDIVEATIISLYAYLIDVANNAYKIKAYLSSIDKLYKEIMRREYGCSEYECDNKLRAFIENERRV